MLCVGQQGGSFGIVGLGREGRTLGKGISIHHIQRQQDFDALGVLRLEQTGQHPPGVGLEEVPVCIPGGIAQLPRPAQAVEAEHRHHGSVVGVVALRENGVVLRREKLIFEKALPVVVACPEKVWSRMWAGVSSMSSQ